MPRNKGQQSKKRPIKHAKATNFQKQSNLPLRNMGKVYNPNKNPPSIKHVKHQKRKHRMKTKAAIPNPATDLHNGDELSPRKSRGYPRREAYHDEVSDEDIDSQQYDFSSHSHWIKFAKSRYGQTHRRYIANGRLTRYTNWHVCRLNP